MPKNWKKYKISEVAETNVSSLGKSSSLEEILYLDTGSVTESRYNLPEKLNISEAPSRAKRIVQHNDLIYSTVRPNQKHYALIKEPQKNLIVSTGFCVLTPKKVNPEFLYYSLTTSKMTDYLHTIAEGSTTTYPSIKPSVLEDLELQLPPLKEQKAIAQILSAIDDKIENNLAINKTLEEMAMALYKHWFVDFGPFQNGEFVDSELGKIPKGWEVKSVFDIATYVNGAAFKSSDFLDDGLYVIKIAELKNGITANTKKSIKKIKPELVLENGSVLFSWSASLDVFLWDKGKALLNQHIFNVLPNGSLKIEILYFLLRELINHFQQIAASRATTMGHIKISHLKETLVAFPSKEKQKEINELFVPLYQQILKNKIENQTLTKLRDTLLPKLISGEIRLKEFQEKVENVIMKHETISS